MKKTEKAFPFDMISGMVFDYVKSDAFKDFLNNVLDMGKKYLDVAGRLSVLEKRMATMEHSLQIMVDARHKLGLDTSSEPVEDEQCDGMKKSRSKKR